jgi:prephenate dehydrogenase
MQATPLPSALADSTRGFPFRSVAVIGLGVMGGSLARALRRLPSPPRIVGFSTNERDRSEAVSGGVLDDAPADAESAAASADLIVYAVPLSAILDLQTRHQSVWRPDAVVSDVSSLKVPVTAQARALGFESRYVSAHPLVGGERSGYPASREELFREALVWLSGQDAASDVRARVERFWVELGARPVWTDADSHDARMVHASHVPQLLSNVLARYLAEHDLARSELGSGGRDMTRLSASSPSMWRDLLEQSAHELAPALREIGAELNALAALLDARDLGAVERLMSRTRDWASGGEHGEVRPPASERTDDRLGGAAEAGT